MSRPCRSVDLLPGLPGREGQPAGDRRAVALAPGAPLAVGQAQLHRVVGGHGRRQPPPQVHRQHAPPGLHRLVAQGPGESGRPGGRRRAPAAGRGGRCAGGEEVEPGVAEPVVGDGDRRLAQVGLHLLLQDGAVLLVGREPQARRGGEQRIQILAQALGVAAPERLPGASTMRGRGGG